MDAEEPALFARPYGVHEGIRRKRVKQLIGALLLGLLLALALAIFRQDVQTSTSLALATLCIASSALLNGVGRPLLAGSVALWTLTVLALYEMWFKQGLYSPACLILPVVLVMANMMVGLRQSLVLLGFIVAGLAVIGLAGAMEWRTFPITPTSFAHLGYIIIIICAFSFMAFVLASDLRKAMAHLREEVTHVTDGQARLQYLAHHDELTALPNRRLGKVLVNKAIAAAQRRASPLALVFIDLDNFKKINDSLGHSAGDELLKEVATRLAHSVRHSDAVFRLGGDEFLVLLPELPSPEDASPLIGRMLGEISRPIKLLGLDVAITGSAGVAMYPEDGTDFDTLSKHADFAAQHAKESGRNAFRYFSNDMNVNMLEDLNLHSAMRLGTGARRVLPAFPAHREPADASHPRCGMPAALEAPQHGHDFAGALHSPWPSVRA